MVTGKLEMAGRVAGVLGIGVILYFTHWSMKHPPILVLMLTIMATCCAAAGGCRNKKFYSVSGLAVLILSALCIGYCHSIYGVTTWCIAAVMGLLVYTVAYAYWINIAD